jgi:hypothetical protein
MCWLRITWSALPDRSVLARRGTKAELTRGHDEENAFAPPLEVRVALEDEPDVVAQRGWTGGLVAAIVIGAIVGQVPAIRAARLSPTEGPRTW